MQNDSKCVIVTYSGTKFVKMVVNVLSTIDVKVITRMQLFTVSVSTLVDTVTRSTVVCVVSLVTVRVRTTLLTSSVTVSQVSASLCVLVVSS